MWTRHGDNWIARMPDALRGSPLVVTAGPEEVTVEWRDHRRGPLYASPRGGMSGEIVRRILEVLASICVYERITVEERARLVSILSWACGLPEVPHG
jgi:hypothetical protein